MTTVTAENSSAAENPRSAPKPGNCPDLPSRNTRPANTRSRAGIARDCDGLITDRPPQGKISGKIWSQVFGSPRRDWRCSMVIVKAAARLAAEPAGLDIFDEQRAGPVFAVGEPLVKHLHDRETSVEPDEVSELERTHRVVEGELAGQHKSIFVGGDAPNQLDQGHDRHRVHEVHADELAGPVGRRGEPGDRDRRGIGGDQRLGLQRRGQLLEDLALDLFFLGRGLYYHVAIAEQDVIEAHMDAAKRRVLFFLANLAAGYLARQVAIDRFAAALQRVVA